MSDAAIEIKELSKIFPPRVIALDNVNLDVYKGEFLVILGPSGSGKTTLLRSIAGLEKPSKGSITINGRVVVDAEKGIYVPPQKRDIGMVFQNWALYPNMKVFDNIAFPLQIKGIPKSEIKKKIEEIASILGISEVLDRYPGQLSGGQQQRVALARALVKEPSVLLLDEPFSNLDARVRVTARAFVKKIQRDLGITTILVTHDQADAFAVGDRIVVIHKGKVIQVGEPKELYEEPADLFIASFIGDPPMNILDWSIVKSIEGLDLIRIPEGSKIGIRPDEASASVEEARAKYRLKGTVELVETAGSRDYAIINVSGHMVKALVKPGDSLKPGDTAHIALKRLYIFGPDGSRIATLRE